MLRMSGMQSSPQQQPTSMVMPASSPTAAVQEDDEVMTEAAPTAADLVLVKPRALPPPLAAVQKEFPPYHKELLKLGDTLVAGKQPTMMQLVACAVRPSKELAYAYTYASGNLQLGRGGPSTADEAPAGKRKRGTGEDPRTTYTRMTWSYIFQVAAMYRTAQAAPEGGGEGRLGLSDAAADALDLAYSMYQVLAGGGKQSAFCGWVPSWWFNGHMTGAASSSGGAPTFYLPQGITGPEDLRQLVMGGLDGSGWLLTEFYKLLMPHDGNPTPYTFLYVDQRRMQLVVDTPLLLETVGSWGLCVWKGQAADSNNTSESAAGSSTSSAALQPTSSTEGGVGQQQTLADLLYPTPLLLPLPRRAPKALLKQSDCIQRAQLAYLYKQVSVMRQYPGSQRASLLCLCADVGGERLDYLKLLEGDCTVAELDECCKKYTIATWEVLLPLFGVIEAVEAAGPAGCYSNLPLTPDTFERVVARALSAAGEPEPGWSAAGCDWAPHLKLHLDLVPQDEKGRLPSHGSTFFNPGLITGPQELLQEVLEGADGPTWLVQQYKKLAEKTEAKPRRAKGQNRGRAQAVGNGTEDGSENSKSQPPYPFLRVDEATSQLLVDLTMMEQHVLGWGRSLVESNQSEAKRKAA